MRKRAEFTASGFLTMTGLRSGRSERVVRDDHNWCSLALGSDNKVVVIVVDAGLVEVTAHTKINLARKQFNKAAKRMVQQKVSVLV